MAATAWTFTEDLTGTPQTTEAWKAAHAACLDTGDDFERTAFVGRWFWLECLCGSRHLCGEGPETHG